MEIEVPYAGEKTTIQVDDDRVQDILYPNEVKKKDQEGVLKAALEDPVEKERFQEFVTDGTVFIVNDGTRPTPTRKVLETMRDDITDREVTFIVATGSHREPTREEYRDIFGDFWKTHRDKIHCHDAEKADMVYYGETERGTPVKFNRIVAEAEKLVAINTVEPHYFAGFTGGRKSFLPGVASYETITQNHYHALEDGASMLSLNGNPVHEDMKEAYRMFDGDVFSLNMTLDKDGDIFHASAGEMEEVFAREVEKAKEIFTVPIEKRADVVVTVSHPIDIDLYQSQKALETGKLALRDEGIIILVSECAEGIGPDNFYRLIAGLDTPEEVFEKIKEEYKLGYHKAAKIVDLCMNSEVWSVTELEDEVIEKVFFSPKKCLQEAVDEALEKTGGKVTFLVEGSLVVPEIDQIG